MKYKLFIQITFLSKHKNTLMFLFFFRLESQRQVNGAKVEVELIIALSGKAISRDETRQKLNLSQRAFLFIKNKYSWKEEKI